MGLEEFSKYVINEAKDCIDKQPELANKVIILYHSLNKLPERHSDKSRSAHSDLIRVLNEFTKEDGSDAIAALVMSSL